MPGIQKNNLALSYHLPLYAVGMGDSTSFHLDLRS